MAKITVGVKLLADALVLTPRRIQQLVEDGVIERIGRGRYDLVECAGDYIVDLRARMSRGELNREWRRQRTRYIGFQADILEFDIDVYRGKFISREEATERYDRVRWNLRSMIQAIPGQAKLLSDLGDVDQIRAALCRSVDDCLHLLRDDPFAD